MMSYNYRPLPSPRHIRLVHIQPAERYAAPIICRIETAGLDYVRDQYDALSYSWGMEADGNADKNELITINGFLWHITKNLFDGIKRIRRDDRPLCVWVDALCINQTDDAERSSQVGMMAEIYGGAKTILVWLGEGGDEDKLMLDLFEQIKEHATVISTVKATEGTDEHCFVGPLLGRADAQCPGCVAASASNGATEDATMAHVDWLGEFLASDPTVRHEAIKRLNVALKFYSKRYWRRRWILQELFFAKQQCLYWGTCSVDLSVLPAGWLTDFARGLYYPLYAALEATLLGLPGADVTPLEYASNAFDQDGFGLRVDGLSQWCTRQDAETRTPPTWADCVGRFHSSACSDPRDIYYALARMATPQIRIDYSLSMANVFVQFAETMLEHGEWHWVFEWAAETVARPFVDGEVVTLPSWVPDPRVVDGVQQHSRKLPSLMGVQFAQDRSLLCDVRCLVPASRLGPKTDSQCDDDKAPPLDFVRTLRDGEIMCSCLDAWDDDDVWLVLRCVAGFDPPTYTLIQVYKISEQVPHESVEVGSAAAWFSACPKITVRIV